MDNRHHVNFMEGNVGVCLPSQSIPSGTQRFGQNQKRTSGDHTSCTVVAKKSLVTRPSRVEHGATKGAPTPLLLLLQSRMYHQNPQMLQLHAWIILPRALDLPDSRKTWLRELPEANFASLPKRYMIRDGRAFALGALPEGYRLGM